MREKNKNNKKGENSAALKKKMSRNAAIGVGMAALAATAAGVYFLYGARGAKERREKIRGWMLRAKGEVLERMEHMKDVSKEAYHRAIDAVAEKYRGMKNVDAGELASMVSDLKRHWDNIKSRFKEGQTSGKGRKKGVSS